jgi:molybdopterin-containing oxidoreductase family membrane subunit
MQETTKSGIPVASVGTSKIFYLSSVILLALVAFGAYGFYAQLSGGLAVTGMRDLPSGAPWGLYVANSVFFEGVAAAGVIVVVAAYLLGSKGFKPLVGIGIGLTAVFLVLAMLSLAVDVGQPLRAPLNLLLYGRWSSPFIWDFAVLAGYVVVALIGVVTFLRGVLPGMPNSGGWIHRLIVGDVDPVKSKKLSEGMMKWIAGLLLVFFVLLSGAVVPYIFGLVSARAGWYDAHLGGFFLVSSLGTGAAFLILVAAALRRSKGIESRTFSTLGKLLLVVNLVTLLFIFSEQATWRFAGTTAEMELSESLLFGDLASVFWSAVAMLVLSTILIAGTRARSVVATVVAGVVALAGLWIDKVIVITSALLHTLLPYPAGVYTPTWVEWALTIGVLAIGLLALMIYVKIFPVVGSGNEEVVSDA